MVKMYVRNLQILYVGQKGIKKEKIKTPINFLHLDKDAAGLFL